MAESTEDTGYSPLLAQMLRIDPAKMGDVSLAALGRQAMGAETPEYKAAKAEVDQARKAMSEALANRQGRVDPSMLALAQGFLAPTKTGSFGESLGTAAGAYSKAQQSEEERIAQIAKMRYELARAALTEEQQAAQMGLSVASKLAPKQTAYQQQVRSEGIDPASPQGVARIKELLALDKATPEMKAFAAQQGISITDPNFAAQFRRFSDTKDLQGIAAKFGFDLSTPEGLKAAQAQAQKDIELERRGKQATLEQTVAQTKRTNQEIAEHLRQGNINAVQQVALNQGVPLDPKSELAGLNPKEAAERRVKTFDEAQKYINEKIAPFATGVSDDLNDLNRAMQLNTEIRTGYTYGIPGVGDVAKAVSGDRAKISEFDSIAARAAKQNRIPGDSNVSNADMRWMQLGTFSSDKQPETNENIIKFMIAQRQRDKDYYDYLQKYAAVNGSVGPHAQAQWRTYLEANPITTRDPVTGRISLNPARMSFQQYFSAPRVKVDAQGNEVQQ